MNHPTIPEMLIQEITLSLWLGRSALVANRGFILFISQIIQGVKYEVANSLDVKTKSIQKFIEG